MGIKKIYNKSDKPDNVVIKQVGYDEEAKEIQKELPLFLRGYFSYLKNNVLASSRVEYLRDLLNFFHYLIEQTDLTNSIQINQITQKELDSIMSTDVNMYIDYMREYTYERKNRTYIYQNDNKSLARKRSSLSVFFKYLYRDGLTSKNITDGFDPIRLPHASDKEIKALEDNEVIIMLDTAKTGEGLSEKEKQYWKKTCQRDYAMLLIFVTYGLRVSELEQLNISSFNFGREEFRIYRKRGKEATMPLNGSVKKAVEKYISDERIILANKAIQTDYPDTEEPLFLSLQGSRMTIRQICNLVKKYTAIAMGTTKRNGYSPHKLRATTATSLIERGNSIYDVQELLSHDNITTTQLYAAHRRGAKRELVGDIDWEK